LRALHLSLVCTAVKSTEVFYLHIDGEERGPYTVSQIDHLLNSGLISTQALYWREGMEQWSPVTELVTLRVRPKRDWTRTAILGGVLVLLLILVRIFGPTAVMGWREASQSDFTSNAAYWRAREVVRTHALAPGAVVLFHKFETASVTLQDTDGGEVVLKGDVSPARGAVQTTTWKVRLAYDHKLKQWIGREVKQLDPPA
jgi:hypothetical protein